MSASEHCAASPQRSEDASEHGRASAIRLIQAEVGSTPVRQGNRDIVMSSRNESVRKQNRSFATTVYCEVEYEVFRNDSVLRRGV
eukprot:366353-Chlamydomonas_euryale.AAC.7